MKERRARIVIAGAALLALLAFAAPQHRANIQILTHDAADRSPAKFQAVLDLGLVAVSVLVTWSKHLSS